MLSLKKLTFYKFQYRLTESCTTDTPYNYRTSWQAMNWVLYHGVKKKKNCSFTKLMYVLDLEILKRELFISFIDEQGVKFHTEVSRKSNKCEVKKCLRRHPSWLQKKTLNYTIHIYEQYIPDRWLGTSSWEISPPAINRRNFTCKYSQSIQKCKCFLEKHNHSINTNYIFSTSEQVSGSDRKLPLSSTEKNHEMSLMNSKK